MTLADGCDSRRGESKHSARILPELLEKVANRVFAERQAGIEDGNERLFVMLAAAGYGMPRTLKPQHGKGQNHAGIFRVVHLEEFSIESAVFLMKKSSHPVRKKLRSFSSQLV